MAANLIGLIYVAAGQDRRGDVLRLIEKASAIAGVSGAHSVMRQIEEASAQL